jgi:predicted phage-related endonuclease
MSVAIHVDQERDTRYLGASEAPGVLGLDKYNPPIKIWRRHRGLEVNDAAPAYLVEAAEWGQVLEPVIRGKYAVRNQCRVLVPVASIVKDGWLRCTPDGLVMDDPPAITPGVGEWSSTSVYPLPLTAGLVQCKNVDAHLEHEWRGDPPPAKEVQARVEMAVTGLPWCDLAALIGGNKWVQYRVERDLEIEARILRDLRAFWTLVQTGEEPTVDHTDAWRLHAGEKMPAMKMVAIADGADYAAMTALRGSRMQRQQAERVERLARNDILLRLAQRAATSLRHPELGTVSAYQTKGRTWALRCPPSWGDDE